MSGSENEYVIESGASFPLGTSVSSEGVNFSIYSKSGTAVELLFFDSADADRPSYIIPFDSIKNRTAHYWHAFISGVRPGQIYGYRVQGPYAPGEGHRFDVDKLLLDPYARAVAVPPSYDRSAIAHGEASLGMAMKSVIADLSNYDWEGDQPLKHPFSKTVIYEMHVGGFTKHPSSGIASELRGTYRGLIEKIPYLQDLGITAVELLPVFQFDVQEAPEGLTNYWGYNPISFFAPHCGYCSIKEPLGAMNEFRDLVKALHKAGIEVILDVVYNHTAEGEEDGPTFCYKGLENSVYYILEEDKAEYANYSGTGNTLKANHSVVRRLILDSLHYWVEEMHIDGFRFDLASILARDVEGKPIANSPVLWEIESDPVLAGTKLIAEAWDAGGLYQVGKFIGYRWKEWNGQFRDDIRSFLRGDDGTVPRVAERIVASPDLYGHQEREPEQSINFVTCHDGFTLNDLVSYNVKHNLGNKENNRDGSDHNLSWNYGIEGPTLDERVEKVRRRQIKNFLVINLMALGVPMLLMGDEVRRTQAGNNNAYCQDSETSWLDWNLLEEHADFHRFVKRLIRLRLTLDIFKYDHGISLTQLLRQAQIQWHGVALNKPDLELNSHSIAFSVRGRLELFYVILNAYWEALPFELPMIPINGEGVWRRIIDTYLDPPEDFCSWESAPIVGGEHYLARPRSVIVLVADLRKRNRKLV